MKNQLFIFNFIFNFYLFKFNKLPFFFLVAVHVLSFGRFFERSLWFEKEREREKRWGERERIEGRGKNFPTSFIHHRSLFTKVSCRFQFPEFKGTEVYKKRKKEKRKQKKKKKKFIYLILFDLVFFFPSIVFWRLKVQDLPPQGPHEVFFIIIIGFISFFFHGNKRVQVRRKKK